MSLTRKTEQRSKNPATKFIVAKCGDEQGNFEHYEKDENDPKKGVSVLIDFSKDGFFVLDYELASIRGWNDDDKYSIYSNEIRTSGMDWAESQILTVMKKPQNGKKTLLAKGNYSSIKDEIKKADGKFNRCVYAMNSKGELIHLSLLGVAFASFMENIENASSEIHQRWIHVKEWKEGKRGAVKYLKPIFSYGEKISDKDYNQAEKLDTILQEYLDGYLKSQGEHLEEKEEASFNTKEWREFKEEGKPKLGSLSIEEIQSLKLQLEEQGDVDTNLYACVGQAVYDFQSLLKTEEWKERKNSAGVTLDKMSLQELKEALIKINSTNPSHVFKLSVEAAIESKFAESGPEEEYPMEDIEDIVPF